MLGATPKVCPKCGQNLTLLVENENYNFYRRAVDGYHVTAFSPEFKEIIKQRQKAGIYYARK